jgi:hypothetical protein
MGIECCLSLRLPVSITTAMGHYEPKMYGYREFGR